MIISALLALLLGPARACDDATRKLARDVYQELVETNTTESFGTTIAAKAMAKRLLDDGFPPADVQVVGPDDKHLNVVARLRGKGQKKPVLWICHLDVVEAKREDWTTDPFKLIEKDGYFYGRGTEDIKIGDALLVTTLIRFKKEGYKPNRDIIIALTAGEETGIANGVEWLLKHRRDLIDAEFILNPDAGAFELHAGKPRLIGMQASEKLYADFQFEVKNKGGHSSQPRADNAIYQLAAALRRLEAFKFPFELNEVTRGYFAKQATLASGQESADMKSILQTPPDEAAAARLSSSTYFNALTRTTCVATRLDAGHANNALPGTARAIVNCRILPGHSAADIRGQLVKIVDDTGVEIAPVGDIDSRPNQLSPLRPDVVGVLEEVIAKTQPGLPIVPSMDTGASDSAITRAEGIPSYGVPGYFLDVDDDRAHGRDERVLVSSFYDGIDFYYAFNKALTSGK